MFLKYQKTHTHRIPIHLTKGYLEIAKSGWFLQNSLNTIVNIFTVCSNFY